MKDKINTQELRLGSLFSLTPDGRNVAVADRVILTSIIRNEFTGGVYPVPLTTEWLRMFKWDGESNSDFWEKDGVVIGYYYGEENGFYYALSPRCTIRITSVHQLQNLYFALTGKELEIDKNFQFNDYYEERN